MADGIYKNGVPIIVTYQAANCGTGLTVLMDVYDEAHAKDAPKCIAAMTEIGATGRYYATFTPDAEGEWIIQMYISAGVGEVVKSFSVAGHNLDEVGDGVAALQTDLDNATDGLGALKTLIDTVNTDLSNGTDGLGALKTLVDTVNTDLSNETDGLSALKTLIDTVNTDLANGTDGLGALKTLIDSVQTDVGAISSPAMVG